MLNRVLCLISLSVCLVLPTRADQHRIGLDPLPVGIYQDVWLDLERFTQGAQAIEVTEFRGDGMRREVAEAILFQQALRRGGFEKPIKLVILEGVGYTRYQLMVAKGTFVAGVQPIWGARQEPHPKDLTQSTAIVREGEFLVGVYAREGHPFTRNRPSLAQVLDLQMTVGANWHVDRQLLETVGWRYTPAPYWDDVLRMLEMNRVDAVLAPFQPHQGMAFQTARGTLYPVLGFKVSFQGTRHYPVSKKHPEARALLEALDQGILAMHRDGSLKRAYTEAGFFNPDTDQWQDVRLVKRVD